MPRSTEIEIQIQVKRRGLPLLRPAVVQLLRAVQRRGSLRTAAQELEISYQTAWTLVSEVNRNAADIVVVKRRGGTHGGGARLTNYGTMLLSEFERIEKEVKRFAGRLNSEINF